MAVPLRLGSRVPAPTPSRTMPGSHWLRKAGHGAHALDQPQNRPAPDEPAGDEHRPVPDPLDQPAARTGHRRGHEWPGRQGEPGTQIEYRHTPVRNSTLVRVWP